MTSGARTAAHDKEWDEGLAGSKGRRAIACILAALVLVVLDSVIANVALPAIAQALKVDAAESIGVVTAYQLALVMTLLPCAALGESLGYRRVYTLGIALFVSASALCAFAPSLSLLVVARFVQGLGGAAIMSLGIALLRMVVPAQQLGTALGWVTLVIALTSALGPTVGALLLSVASWPWLFAINLPLGALVLAATRALPNAAGTKRRLDLISVMLNAVAFAALILGAELLLQRAGLSTLVFGIGIAAMAWLIARQIPQDSPMLPLDLLRARSFRISVIASVCCFIGQSAAMISLPFYLQHDLHQDVLSTGLLITPWPLSVALVAPLAGRLTNHFSGAWLCALGGALLAIGLLFAALWPLHGSPAALVPFLALSGAGFGLFQVSNNRNMFLSVPSARSGAAGGLQSTARLTGQTIGSVVMTLLFAALSSKLAPRIGLASAAVLTLVAGLVSALRTSPRSEPGGGVS